MAVELVDKKGTAYLQGIQGLNYLGKMSGYKKPMNILKSYLKRNAKRKTLYLKFNDGKIEEVRKGVYQIKINPSDKHFLNDLRDELDGEKFSHACAISRSLDAGAVEVYQIGIRAYSKEELEKINSDSRINTWFSKDIMAPCSDEKYWNEWIDTISNIKGPVHLTIDIDGLDGSLVPATGTPVPGGLSFWHAIQTIETLLTNCNVISADVNEIVPQQGSNLTQFTAAMLVTKIVAAKIKSMK